MHIEQVSPAVNKITKAFFSLKNVINSVNAQLTSTSVFATWQVYTQGHTIVPFKLEDFTARMHS